MKCVECRIGETTQGTTSLTYTRPGSKLQIVVIGVPADVCPHCGEAYLSEDIAQEVFEIVDGILELGKTLKEGTLPIPQIEIHFSSAKRLAA
jgi:YgiT-type zinc finger domain-containing protein